MAGFNKVVDTYEEALAGLEDGMTVLAGGFGLCGIPENLISEIKRKQTKNLTVVSNNCGVAEGKDTREFNGREYLLEESITGDFAIVKGWKADRYGNVVYRHTAQNFNPLAATAGKVTVVEVEEIVETGSLDPAHIHTPGIYVDRVIVGTFEKRIEKRTVSE